MGCCNIPVASLRKSVYHRGLEIPTLCIPLILFKTVKCSPNVSRRLEMNVYIFHVVISLLDFFFL